MKTRFIVLVSLVSASAFAALISACSGGDNSGIDGGPDATSNDAQQGNDGANGNDGTTGTDSATDSGTKDSSAKDGGCVRGPGCAVCCAATYPDAEVFVRDTERNCACTTPGDCKDPTVCGGSLCNGNKASATCDTCLNDKDAGDCKIAAALACEANAKCKPLITCLESCIADAGGGG